MKLPTAILLDLDDTILDDSSAIESCWRRACAPEPIGDALFDAIGTSSKWYWGDPDRHRTGRLELNAARREVVRLALTSLGIDDPACAARVGDAYSRGRDAEMVPLPDAIDTVEWLRSQRCRLAMLTNGASDAQWQKITRFGLTDLFDAILVEGEVGFGKPDERIYCLALERLGVEPSQAWMAGDNLEWDVATPQRLGIFSIWIDRHGRGLPGDARVRPDRIVRSLSELRTPAG
jgi:putative hydrolase of the HAD superfamily